MKTGPHLKKLRVKKGYFANYVAHVMGINRVHLHRLESGKHFPSKEVLIKYLHAIESKYTKTLHKKVLEDLHEKWAS